MAFRTQGSWAQTPAEEQRRPVVSRADYEPLDSFMILTIAEERAVRRAVVAYRAMCEKETRGAFRGVTADAILEELHPTPIRWVALASLVVSRAQGETLP